MARPPGTALYTLHSTLYTLHSTLYCTLHSTVFCTPYSTLSTLHSPLCMAMVIASVSVVQCWLLGYLVACHNIITPGQLPLTILNDQISGLRGVGAIRNTSPFLGLYSRPPIRTKMRTRSTQKFRLGPLRNTSLFLGLYSRPPIRTEKRTWSTQKCGLCPC